MAVSSVKKVTHDPDFDGGKRRVLDGAFNRVKGWMEKRKSEQNIGLGLLLSKTI